MIALVLSGCGTSALDRPAADVPVRPARTESGAVSLPALSATFQLPPSVRPGGAAAPADLVPTAPFVHHDDRKKASVWRIPLPVAADLLPSSARGTHNFGSTAPPGMAVFQGEQELSFEQMGKRPGTWGYDRDFLYVGVELGAEGPAPGSVHVTFPKATAVEASMNLATSTLAAEVFARRTFTVGGVSHAGWFLPAPASVRVSVPIPAGGVLAFSPGLVPPAITALAPTDGATVTVSVRTGGTTEVLSTVPVRDASFSPVRVDLARFAGTTVELELTTEAGADNVLDYVLLEDPVVYPASAHPRKFVMLFVDTLRPDHLGFQGYTTHATSPHLDRWAAHAAVFTAARTLAPWTLPSARAVLTGSEPESWSARTTLAARFSAAGFRTDALVSNAFLSQPFGLDRGWDRFRYEHLLPPDLLVTNAIERLNAWPDRDQLLMVHFMGPHLPWDEPAWYRWRWAGRQPASLRAPTRGQLGSVDEHDAELDEVREWATARYDQNVRWVDDELGRLLEAVGTDATVVLFSDHGEELWEHGGFEHGHAFGEELLRVPLVVKSPGLVPGRFDAPVSLLDLAPTLLELAGLPADDDADGSSLVPYVYGDAGAAGLLEARPLGFGRPLYGDDGWGVISASRKWTARDGRQTLFDLATDPGEQTDLGATADLSTYPSALSAALGRPVHPVWRVSLEGEPWSTPLTLTLSHPDGLTQGWLAYDPRGRGAALVPEVVDGRVQLTIPADTELPAALYVLPVADVSHPGGLAATLTGRGVQLGSAVPLNRVLADERASVVPFLATRDARYTLLVDRAVVPEPSGDEVSGYHPDLESQLKELGYLGE